MLHLLPQARRARTWAMIALAVMVLLFNAGFPSTPAEAADSVKALNIEGVGDLPFILDDEGNLWATAVSSRAYRMNQQLYRSRMVKAEHMKGVVSLSGQYAVKDDGSVWITRYDEPSEQDKDKWGLSMPKFVKQVPHLKNIVSVTGVLALDRDGKLWAFDTFPRIIQEGNDFVAYPPLHEEPFPVEGVGRIKDMYGSTILKEDGTVWAWGCTVGCHNLPEIIGTTAPTQIRGLEDIVKIGYDIALKKDGTVWVWGYNYLAKPKSEKYPKNVTPFPLEGLTDIIDISYSNSASLGGHMLALKKDGTVWSMGYFPNTRTGISYPSNYMPLHQIEGLTDVLAVFSGKNTNAVIKKDGSLWMWGTDRSGLFGERYGDAWALHDQPVRVELTQDAD